MKTRISNFKYDFMTAPLAEIEIVKVWVDSSNKACTVHKVSTVGTVDGEEIIRFQKQMNHRFEYQGGDIIAEALASLVEYLQSEETD